MNKKIFLLLLIIFSVGIRWLYMPDTLFFGPEQGRDFLAVEKIVRNLDITLIGSKTDVDGVFHGPAFYYLIALPFFLSGGNPVSVAFFLIILYALAVLAVYELNKDLFGVRAGLLSALLYTTSFHAIEYSRWLSNPGLSLPLSAIFFLSVMKAFRGKKIFVYLFALSGALLGQVEFINFLFVIPIVFFVFFQLVKKGFSIKLVTVALTLFLFFSGVNYVIFDFRHDHILFHGLLNLITGSTGHRNSFVRSLMENWNMYSTVVGWTFGIQDAISSQMVTVVIIFTALFIAINQKNYLPLLWIGLPFSLLTILQRNVLVQIYGFCVVGFISLASYIASRKWLNKWLSWIFVCIVSIVNIYYCISVFRQGNTFFQSTQPKLRYSDMISSIDTVYSWVDKEPFSFQSYTIPYFWQDAWKYLFNWYGKKTYGYTPVAEKAKYLYVFIQKDWSNQGFQKSWYHNTVTSWGTKHRTANFGDITVEELLVPESQRL